ncbi:MAG: endonuclease-3, partial [Paraglaciecola sp.]
MAGLKLGYLKMNKQENVQFVIDKLEELYPEIPIPLEHKDPYT